MQSPWGAAALLYAQNSAYAIQEKPGLRQDERCLAIVDTQRKEVLHDPTARSWDLAHEFRHLRTIGIIQPCIPDITPKIAYVLGVVNEADAHAFESVLMFQRLKDQPEDLHRALQALTSTVSFHQGIQAFSNAPEQFDPDNPEHALCIQEAAFIKFLFQKYYACMDYDHQYLENLKLFYGFESIDMSDLLSQRAATDNEIETLQKLIDNIGFLPDHAGNYLSGGEFVIDAPYLWRTVFSRQPYVCNQTAAFLQKDRTFDL